MEASVRQEEGKASKDSVGGSDIDRMDSLDEKKGPR